ncbi:MAG: hypothetical protein OEV88_13990, partial [Gammaproteobacteria bacterium]|nr:hypothetical protein [Gammaproteobacteria bacterium]
YDQLRLASGRGVGSAWLPVALWRLATALLDITARRRGESMFDKLFGTELYSNRALLAATSWRPRLRLQDVAADLVVAGGGGG